MNMEKRSRGDGTGAGEEASTQRSSSAIRPSLVSLVAHLHERGQLQPLLANAGLLTKDRFGGYVRDKVRIGSGDALESKPGAFAGVRLPGGRAALRSYSGGSVRRFLESSAAFERGDAIKQMLRAYGVPGNASLIEPIDLPEEARFRTLRKEQAAGYAAERVRQGVEQARLGRYDPAMSLYNAALSVDPSFVDGWVAQGAAYATVGDYVAATRDLKRALELDPEHGNAKKYLAMVTKAQSRPADHSSTAVDLSGEAGRARPTHDAALHDGAAAPHPADIDDASSPCRDDTKQQHPIRSASLVKIPKRHLDATAGLRTDQNGIARMTELLEADEFTQRDVEETQKALKASKTAPAPQFVELIKFIWDTPSNADAP